MEFKGTKGKWVSNYSNGSWLIQDLETYQDGFKSSIAEVYWFNDEKDTAEHNALLISKSPEMLEMLKEFVDNCCGEQKCEEELIKGLGNTLYNSVLKAKRLIKQATEL